MHFRPRPDLATLLFKSIICLVFIGYGGLMNLSWLLLLYICFRLKQFTCDFLLQTDWMALNKGRPGWEGYKALLTHSFLHGIGTTIIVLIFLPSWWWLGLVDFAVHSAVDRA